MAESGFETNNVNSVESKYLYPQPGKNARQMVAYAEDHRKNIPTPFAIWRKRNGPGSTPSAKKAVTAYNNSGRAAVFNFYHSASLKGSLTDDDLAERAIWTSALNSEVFTETFMSENNYEIRLDYAVDESGTRPQQPLPSTVLTIANGTGDFIIRQKEIAGGRSIFVLDSDTGAPAGPQNVVKVFKDEGILEAQISIYKNGVLLMTRGIGENADTALIELKQVYGVAGYVFIEESQFASRCGPVMPISPGQIAWLVRPERSTAYIQVTPNTGLLQIPTRKEMGKEDAALEQNGWF